MEHETFAKEVGGIDSQDGLFKSVDTTARLYGQRMKELNLTAARQIANKFEKGIRQEVGTLIWNKTKSRARKTASVVSRASSGSRAGKSMTRKTKAVRKNRPRARR